MFIAVTLTALEDLKLKSIFDELIIIAIQLIFGVKLLRFVDQEICVLAVSNQIKNYLYSMFIYYVNVTQN